MHQAILAWARDHGSQALKDRLRFIRSSSAPLPPRIFAELEQAFETPVIEWYGMTEVTASPIACNPLPPRRRKPGSVGVRVSLDVAVMEEGGALLPCGQQGQVVVRGPTLMEGYDGNPAATRAAFAGDWFKTGDLGFFDDDGYLFLTGRVREIINRGGQKVAPQEVDEVLLEHPAVAEVVTFPAPHATLGEDVASAVVLRPGAVATPKDIRQFTLGRIADFKIPRQVLIVSEIPKGPTGKVQRIGLAAKLGLAIRPAPLQDFVAPRTPLEHVLAKHWASLLQVEQIGIHDNFFTSGGDSLRAYHVLRHVYDIAQVELEVRRFFEAPTVADVARHLEQSINTAKTARSRPALVRRPGQQGAIPASIAQERTWNLHHALPDVPFSNVVYALRLKSPCDAAVLERSINEVVRRHDILRTTFTAIEGRRVQVIARRCTSPLTIDDLSRLEGARRRAVVRKIYKEELLHSFDLVQGPLFRARLLRLTRRTHLLILCMHEIIQDGWSLGVLCNELATLYDAFSEDLASPLPALPIQYADFAHWQRLWRSNSDMVTQLAYWRKQLSGPLPAIKFAKIRRGRKADALHTARRQVKLPIKLARAAKRLGQREGATLFVTLLAALKLLLHLHSDNEDLRVASHVANRNRPHTSELIGPLVNTVILRTNLGGDPSSREVLRRVRATTFLALANQDIPFEEVVSTLERERGLKPAALAQVMMWLQNEALRPTVTSRHKLAFEEADPGVLRPIVTITTFDLVLMLRESTLGLVGTCVYKPHVFTVDAVDGLLEDFQRVLEYMVRHPDRPISAIAESLKRKTKSAGKVARHSF
jgi:hypothetical protein